MTNTAVQITSPVGRIVMGSLYTPNKTDADGNPLVFKNGPQAGQPRVQYFVALAIPKGAEKNWWETAWGAKIAQVGMTAFPQASQAPSFAWKVEDGDSSIPNKKGRKPCDNEGWPGHWIVKLSNGFAPKVYRQEGTGYVQVIEADYVKPGHYVEIAFSVDGNGSAQQPGVYLNMSMVCFRAFGPEIAFGMKPEEAGFGAAPLPAGASMVPLASTMPPPAAAAAPTAPGTPTAMIPGAPALGIATSPTPALPVTPNPGFLAGPSLTPQPGPAAPAPPTNTVTPASPSNGHQMTPKAGGVTYEAFIGNGWTDAQLVAQGYMLA